jgi:hypothetical protein
MICFLKQTDLKILDKVYNPINFIPKARFYNILTNDTQILCLEFIRSCKTRSTAGRVLYNSADSDWMTGSYQTQSN